MAEGGILRKFINEGFKTDIQPIGADSRNPSKTYSTQIYEIVSDEEVTLYMPTEKEKLVLLPVGRRLDVYFFTPGGLYQCYAVVEDRYREGRIYLLVLRLTSNLRKHQRREYYRLSCSLSMESRALEEDEAIPEKAADTELEIKPGLPLKRSIIVDISGGGIRFVSNYRYPVGEKIIVRYDLVMPNGSRRYNIVSKILASDELINRPGSFEHRAEYVNIDKDTREEIIKYIFNTERMHRKKTV